MTESMIAKLAKAYKEGGSTKEKMAQDLLEYNADFSLVVKVGMAMN